MSFSMNIPFSISSLFLLFCQFEMLGFLVVASSELSSLAPWLLGFPEQLCLVI